MTDQPAVFQVSKLLETAAADSESQPAAAVAVNA